MAGNLSVAPRLVRAILVTREGLERSAIANFFRRIFPTSLAGDVTSEIAEDDWVRGCRNLYLSKVLSSGNKSIWFNS